MTLTAMGCPLAGMITEQVREKLLTIEGVGSSKVELVWDPPWNPNMMSDEAKLQLGYM